MVHVDVFSDWYVEGYFDDINNWHLDVLHVVNRDRVTNLLENWYLDVSGVMDRHWDFDWKPDVLVVVNGHRHFDVLSVIYMNWNILDLGNISGAVNWHMYWNLDYLYHWNLDVLYVVHWMLYGVFHVDRNLLVNRDLDMFGVVNVVWHLKRYAHVMRYLLDDWDLYDLGMVYRHPHWVFYNTHGMSVGII